MIRSGFREQYVVPKEYQARLTKAGGLNRFNQPNFRLVWGHSRLDWLYSPRNGHYHLAPKYPVRPNRWYVEQWLPPEKFGTPDSWKKMQSERIDGVSIDLCGPYPHRGEYEMLLMLETPHRTGCESVAVREYEGCPSCGGGRFIQPTSFIVDQIVRLVERSRNRSERDRYNDVLDTKDAWVKDFDSTADDMLKDLQPTFGSQTVYLGGLEK